MPDTQTIVGKLLLKPPQAAEALAISPRKLWELTDRGIIKVVRIGRAVRYDPTDLTAFIAKQKRGAE
jgi:excisionase family DNA binding protein